MEKGEKEIKEKKELEKQIDEKIKFLKGKKSFEIAKYDVKDEFIELDKVKLYISKTGNNLNLKLEWQNLGPAEKMMIYKYFAKKLKLDCDVSLLSVVIYQQIYCFLKESEIHNQTIKNSNSKYKYELKKKDIIYHGDIMTSSWTTFKEYLRMFHSDVLQNGHVPNYDKNMDNIKQWKDHIISKIHDGGLVIHEDVKNFLKSCSNIGNTIPVPKCFNVERSGCCARWDYWDLTLLAIYNWYNDNDMMVLSKDETEDRYLKKLFSKANIKGKTPEETRQDALENCKVWLENFETWNDFIEENYLQDFVNKMDSGYGKPIMFWEGHSFKNSLPQTEEQFLTFFIRVNSLIKLRGIRICKALSKALQEK